MKQRLNWIDALRGLTMLSVVLVHVLTVSFGVHPDQSALCILRGTFTLPLFFFVSGFFLYRPVAAWDKARVKNALRVRSIAMIGGTLIFCTLYGVVSGAKNPLSWWPHGNFDKYWYTWSLFQIFIYYMLLVAAMRRCGEWLIWLAGGLLVAFNFAMPYIPLFDGYWCEFWINKKTAIYSQFFVAGLLVRRYEGSVMKWLDRREMLSWVLVGYVGLLILGWRYQAIWQGGLEEIGIWVRDFWARLFGITLLLQIFYHNREFFNRDTRAVRIWLLIGRRTLDIYFLHYFLLPRMRWMSQYVSKGNTFIVELGAGLIVAAVVLLVVMGLSHLLRRAPGIRLLLGEKSPLPKQPKASAA